MSESNSSRIPVLTGDRPTGPLHLGHYVGSLQQRVAMQSEGYDVFVLMADAQALTDNWTEPEKVRDNIAEVLLDYLAVGIDPMRSTIMLQTSVPELTELTFYYSNLVTIGRLQRNPTVKTEIAERGFSKSLPAGFLCYPISQAADITAFNAHVVPVGDDQLPMIEQTREIVRSFNRIYGNTLTEPSAMLSRTPRLPGTDGARKMSKSSGNCIYLSDPPDVIQQKIKKMYTDPSKVGVDGPGRPEENPVYVYLDTFDPDRNGFADLRERYRAGGVSEVVGKRRLTDVLIALLEPIQRRRREFASDRGELRMILRSGTERGRHVASQSLRSVRAAMKLDFLDDA